MDERPLLVSAEPGFLLGLLGCYGSGSVAYRKKSLPWLCGYCWPRVLRDRQICFSVDRQNSPSRTAEADTLVRG
jgi:hypothetical protein